MKIQLYDNYIDRLAKEIEDHKDNLAKLVRFMNNENNKELLSDTEYALMDDQVVTTQNLIKILEKRLDCATSKS